VYSLIRSLPVRRLVQEQLPALTLSIVIAELFYKFHSFTLETLAFLATWGVIDAGIQLVRRRLIAADPVAVRSGHRVSLGEE